MGVMVPNFASSTEDRASGAQVIEGSLKFNKDLKTRLERTPSAEGNRRTYTISFWCKRNCVETSSGSAHVFSVKGVTGNSGDQPIAFDSGRLRHSLYLGSGGDIWGRTTEQYFRDTGWYHVVASVDTTHPTTDDRVKIYVNGERITDFTDTARPSQNYEGAVNDDTQHALGWWIHGSGRAFDGHLAQFHLIDGSQLDSSHFGYTDPLTNIWRPKTFNKSNIPNRKGRVFSSTFTASGNGFGSNPTTYAFNGDLSNGFNNSAGGQIITWNSSTFNLSGNVRMYTKSSSGAYDIYINGNSTKVADTGSSYAWVDCGTHDNITEIQWAGTSYNTNTGLGSAGIYVAAIIVDGVWLRDDMHEYGLNGSFLPLDGNTLIGQDQSGNGNNWKLIHLSNATYTEKATGALPILNTINGGRVAAPGVRGYFGSKIVTVASSKFVVDGVSQASLQLLRGGTYKFDQSDSSNTGHPLRFSTTDNGSHGGGSEYTDGRVTNGTPGSAGAYTTITVPHNAANTLYYYCTAHSGMGGDMSVTTDVTKADPYAWKCKLALPLLNEFDYSNTINCTTTAKTVTTVGNAAVNNKRHNFYGGSYYFDGTSDSLHVPDSTDWEPGSGDWTMEMWIRRFRVDSDEWLFIHSDGTSANTGLGIHIWASSNGTYGNMLSGRMRISGSNADCNGSTKLVQNTWYHCAFTREGDKCRIWLNGQLDGEVTNSGTIATSSAPLVIGAVNAAGSACLKGWIQDVRFYKGVAKYTKEFIPATSFPNVLPETPSGTAYGSELTIAPKGGSVQFDGKTNHLYVANHADMNPGSGDFTVEGWIYVSKDTEDSWASVGGLWNFGSNRRTWTLQIEKSTRKVYFYCSGDGSNSYYAVTANTKISFDRWHHCAGVRKGNTLTVYLDGIAGATTGSISGSVYNNTSDRFRVGDSSATGSHNTKGYISNFRFVKGTAVYTDNFEPPTEPLTAITNTKLLCCQDPTTVSAAAVSPNISGINDGTTWSQYAIGESLYQGTPNAFDGNNPNLASQPKDGTTIVFTPPSTLSGAVRIYGSVEGTESSTNTLKLNGSSIFAAFKTALGNGVFGWYTTGVNTLSSLEWGRASGSAQVKMSAIEVGGTVLLDPVVALYNGNILPSRFSPFGDDIDTVRGQETGYATFSQNDCGPNTVVTNGGLQVIFNGGNLHQSVPASIPYPRSGKWYCEFTTNSVSSDSTGIALVKYDYPDFTVEGNAMANANPYLWSRAYECRGRKIINGSDQGANTYGDTFFDEGDVIGVAVDFSGSQGVLRYYLNGISQGDHTTDIDLNFEYIIVPYGYCGAYHQYIANFGQKPFAHTPPEGYKTLCAANLPRQDFVRPDKYVKPVTWTGTTANDIIVDCGFQPDLVFMKSRTQTYGWYWYDSVRGGTNGNGPPVGPDDKQTALFLNSTGNAAETNANTDQIVMTPTGFVVDKDGQGIGEASQGANNMVGYAFRAGGWKGTFNIDDVSYATAAAAGVASGTTDPTACSISTKAGFAILKYQGNATANSTIAHGLGRKPAFIIIKKSSGSADWAVYHESMGLTGTTLDGSAEPYMAQLNATSARVNTSQDTIWNCTDTTFKFDQNGGAGWVNANGGTYISYVWANVPGFQKFGGFTSSGASSGPFVYTGFRPAIVMYKNITSTEAWSIVDSAQDSDNPQQSMLLPSATNTKLTSNAVDLLSNGFKVRTTNNPNTGNDNDYIYAAWAEAPLNGLYGAQSNAR